MNDSLYEEYMRSVLGYQPMNYSNTYGMNYQNYEVLPSMINYSGGNEISNMQNSELESYYPDIYKIVYPMVEKVCNQNTRPLTRELIDNMTEEIYSAIQDREMGDNRNKDETKPKEAELNVENRQRIIINSGLNDLIRILLLRELLRRPGFPGGRPPRPRPPRPPMRPPMGPPPRPQPRPGMGPFNRQSFGQYDDLYEY